MAADAANIVLGAIIEKAITPVVDVIGRHLGYLFCYKSNIKNLGTTAAQLEKSRNDADNFFKGQKWNNEEIAHSSVGWLEEVEKVIKDAKEVEDATAKLNGCLNLKGRYVQSRRSTKLAVEIQTLQNKAPKGITTNTILPAGRIRGALANEASKGYKTRMETMDEVMKALEDHAISVIGICGLGGVGKTTLVHELRDRVRKQNLFYEVAMTSVSQNVDVFKIQGDLAEMLGLIRLKEEKNVIARADQLQKRLTNGNKVLVILDDVWSDIKLKDIGIPVGSGHIGCKVLITSRQKDVCTGIQMNIEVKVLPKEEARAMFRERAGDCVDRDNLEDIANDIADRCGGLPVALLALSRALSNKDRRLWVDAHTRLRDGSLLSIHGMEKQVYQSIKLSYDFLAIEKQEEAQSLLLLCSQHPEDAEIEIEKLARYCLSLGLFEGITEVTRARNRVYTLIELLKSCFFLQAIDVEKVRVHGVVRDVCLSTVKVERDRVYMHFWKQEGDTGIVTRDINYPKLKILVEVPLYHDDISGIISFLKQMQELRVLESCRDFSLFSLRAQNADPSWALHFLTNLRMLSLEDTNVLPALMSEFTRLKKLETLSFLGSTVSSFPHKIGQLSNLKLLDLRYEFSSETSMMPIPSGILPNLTKLEVLFMGKHHFSGAVPYEDEDEDDMDKESCHGRIEELDSLTNLTTLQVDFLDPMQLLDLKNFRFEKLEGFIFGSGGKSLPFVYCDKYPLFMKNICLREVAMEWVFGDQIQSIVRSTVDLSLEDIKDWYDPLVFKQFSSLKKLEMTGCHQLEYIIHDGNGDDSHSSNAFKNVEILRILDMENVGELCHNGNLPSGSLRKLQLLEIHSLSNMRHLWVGPTDPLCLVNLKVVIIKYCETLKCLFPHSAAKGLSQLQSLNVESCGMLEEIVSRGEGTATREGEIAEESNDLLIHFSKLTNVIINESPNLRSFYNLDDGRGQSFFNSVGILHSIENLEVYENHSIKAVFDFEGLQATTMNDKAPSLLSKLQAVVLFRLSKLEHIWRQIPKHVHIFQNLGTLDVVDCGSLAYLIPSSIAHMLVNLQKIVVKGCKVMKEVISKTNEDCGELEKKIVFRSLRSLELEDLENLSSFCPIDHHVFEFPSLEELSIIKCPEIETFCCQVLRVVRSGMLEENVSNGEETTKGGEVKRVPSDLVTQFPKLKKLIVHRAPNLRGFYNLDNDKGYQHQMVMLPSIEELDVFQNHSLKTVFDFEGLEGMTMREDAHSLLCKLHRIVIWDLPKLEHFCKKVPKGFHLFQNLDTLDVEDCGGLVYLIPSSIAYMLMNLRLLTVKGCKGMQEVFKMNEDCGKLENKTIFRSLRIVKLEDLGSLSSFCSSGQEVFEFPSLEELSIIECPEMETFCCQIPRTARSGMLEENLSPGKGTSKGGEGEERKKVLSTLVAQFPKLEELILKGTPNLRGFYNLDNDEGFHQLDVSTPELRSIDVRRCDSLGSIAASSSLKLRQNLKHVRLMNCKAAKAVVDFEGFEVTREYAHSLFIKLEAIWLRELPNLEHIFRLVPKEINGFQNLTSLHAYRCHSLSYLLTSTMAHMLLNLKFLIVWDCNSMKEVIKVNEDCGEKKIVFRSLHYVFLSSEKLSSFCSSELQEFDFPSMTQVYIVKCPEMTTFCCGNLTAEKLRGVHYDDKNDDDYNNYEEGEYDDYFDDSDNNDDGSFDIFWKGGVNETICHCNARVNRIKSGLEEEDSVDEDDVDNVDEDVEDEKEDGVDDPDDFDDDDDDDDEEDANDVEDKRVLKNDLNETAQHLNERVAQISDHVREDDVGDKDAKDVHDIHVPEKGVDDEYNQCGNEEWYEGIARDEFVILPPASTSRSSGNFSIARLVDRAKDEIIESLSQRLDAQQMEIQQMQHQLSQVLSLLQQQSGNTSVSPSSFLNRAK